MELQLIQQKIFEIRGQKVMLDFDLAEMYETETKYLKRAVKRNLGRFPPDFMMEITTNEWDALRCHFGTLETGRGKHPKYLPYAFTEQGVAMLSTVLNSEKAIEINIAIMRAFVAIRRYALTHSELTKRLETLEIRFEDFEQVLPLLLKERKTQIELKEAEQKTQKELQERKKVMETRERIGYKK